MPSCVQADVATKEWIADELLQHEDELMVGAPARHCTHTPQHVKFGIIVARNCKLQYFKRKRGDWCAAGSSFSA